MPHPEKQNNPIETEAQRKLRELMDMGPFLHKKKQEKRSPSAKPQEGKESQVGNPNEEKLPPQS